MSRTFSNWFFPGLFAIVAVVHFLVLNHYAVNVPFWDEWMVWWHWDSGLLPWLWRRHNEHRIPLVKLLIYLSDRLDGGNFIHLMWMNYALYLGFLALLYQVGCRFFPKGRRAPYLFFLTLLLSFSPHENLQWGFQAVFHLPLIFFVGGALLLFDRSAAPARLSAGVACAVAAIFSLSSGVMEAAALVGIYGAFACARGLPKKNALTFAGVVLIAVVLWGVGYVRPAHHPDLVLPNHWAFYDFFLNLVSFGFGVREIGWGIGLVALVACLTPQAILFRREGLRADDNAWLLAALTAGTLAALAAIAAGRVGFNIGVSKASRYGQIASVLVPVTVCAWYRWAARPRTLVILGVLLFVAFRLNWSPTLYEPWFAQQFQGLECVKRLHRGEGGGSCPTIFPEPLGPILRQVCTPERASRPYCSP